MFLSRSCEYAIQAVLYLAKHNDIPYISIKVISDEYNISFHFLGKILQTLTKKGILTSYKGPKGGVSLAKLPEEILLIDIIEAIDGLKFFKSKCAVGIPICQRDEFCLLHEQWNSIQDNIYNMFADKNIAQLIK